MRIVPWLLKIYCCLARAGYVDSSLDAYAKWQEQVLREINH